MGGLNSGEASPSSFFFFLVEKKAQGNFRTTISRSQDFPEKEEGTCHGLLFTKPQRVSVSHKLKQSHAHFHKGVEMVCEKNLENRGTVMLCRERSEKRWQSPQLHNG